MDGLGCSAGPVDKDVRLVCMGYRWRVLLLECTRFDRLVVVGHVVGVDNGGRMLFCREHMGESCRL